MCQDALIIQGDDRKWVSGCGDLCRVLGITLADLPGMDYSSDQEGTVVEDGNFKDNWCLCHIDFDRLGIAWGFTVRREPMEVILTGPPAADAKYRRWAQERTGQEDISG